MVTIMSRRAGLFKAFLSRRRLSHAYAVVIFASGGGARAKHGKINGPLRVKNGTRQIDPGAITLVGKEPLAET